MIWIAGLWGQLKPRFGGCGCGVGHRNLGERLGLSLPWTFSSRTARLRPRRSSGRRPVFSDIFKPVVCDSLALVPAPSQPWSG